MTLGTVQQLYRYPVKSMGGEAIRTAVLGKLGIEGDRAWALRDEETGHMTGGKRIPALMRFSARTSGDAAEITLPDGTTVSTAAADASEVVSNALGRKVSLQALRPPEDLDFYRQRATPPTTSKAICASCSRARPTSRFPTCASSRRRSSGSALRLAVSSTSLR